jgi:hypothetical protein
LLTQSSFASSPNSCSTHPPRCALLKLCPILFSLRPLVLCSTLLWLYRCLHRKFLLYYQRCGLRAESWTSTTAPLRLRRIPECAPAAALLANSRSLNGSKLCIPAVLFVLTLMYVLGEPDYTCSCCDLQSGAEVRKRKPSWTQLESHSLP